MKTLSLWCHIKIIHDFVIYLINTLCFTILTTYKVVKMVKLGNVVEISNPIDYLT